MSCKCLLCTDTLTSSVNACYILRLMSSVNACYILRLMSSVTSDFVIDWSLSWNETRGNEMLVSVSYGNMN